MTPASLCQPFAVDVRNVATGETWSVTVQATDPPSALARVLRRKLFAEWLCSEQPFKFTVRT